MDLIITASINAEHPGLPVSQSMRIGFSNISLDTLADLAHDVGSSQVWAMVDRLFADAQMAMKAAEAKPLPENIPDGDSLAGEAETEVDNVNKPVESEPENESPEDYPTADDTIGSNVCVPDPVARADKRKSKKMP